MNKKPKYNIKPEETRTYHLQNSCIFKKNNEAFGELSNMSTQFPISVNGIKISTVEALYQAMRFPHLPHIQNDLIIEKSPMRVKMISNKYKKESRSDWEEVRVKIMKWSLNVKFCQNVLTFSEALHKTGNRNIVENSSSDNFWGAIPDENGTLFKGKNALGRLLMDLREKVNSPHWIDLLYVDPPAIPECFLFEKAIEPIDERANFILSLFEYWKQSKFPLRIKQLEAYHPSFDLLNNNLGKGFWTKKDDLFSSDK